MPSQADPSESSGQAGPSIPPEIPVPYDPPVAAELSTLVDVLRAGELTQIGPLHPRPQDGSGRPAAVLIVFSPAPQGRDGLGLLLTQRTSTLRKHAGQVAFPGGSIDPDDADHFAAALREAEEEVGLDPKTVRILGELPPALINRTGFVVTPVLAWWPLPHPVGPVDPGEVARVAVVAVADLVEPANRFQVRHPLGLMGPGFEVDGLFVWGFTAMVLDRLLELAGWSVPWDSHVIRELPPEYGG